MTRKQDACAELRTLLHRLQTRPILIKELRAIPNQINSLVSELDSIAKVEARAEGDSNVA